MKIKMVNFKKIIIPIIIIIILCIIALIVLTSQLQKGEAIKNEQDNTVISSDIYNYEDVKTEAVTDATSFYTVAQCVSAYLNNLNVNNSSYFGKNEQGQYVKVIDENTIAQSIIDILDKDYVKKNTITTNNVYQFVEKVTQKEIFVPLKMNILPGKTIEQYAVYGFTEDMEHNIIREIYVIVNLDIQNNTYAIEPLLNNSYQNIEDIQLLNKNIPIEKNDNNQYQYEKVNNGYISNKYLDSYKKMILSNSKLAYEYLDTEYKNARFGSYEKFHIWLNDNKQKMNQINLQKYSVRIENGYTQYICLDQNNNYYIFRETAPMQYTVILDTYTIDLPEFTEKYEKAPEEEKVLINIQKFFMALDMQDYRYAYSKLDETFKANNFATQAEFETYVKNTFFASNKLAVGTAEKQNDIYLYKITITDKSGEKAESVSKTFVMQLKEGTDFAMSFSK